MKEYNLSGMKRGWFVGDFSPSCLRTRAVEAGLKRHRKGTHEEPHFHKVSTEITVIISGRALMNGKEFGPGDIIVVHPGETAAFTALEDTATVVVKVPGAPGDKFKGKARRC
jgi:hypothetical protein